MGLGNRVKSWFSEKDPQSSVEVTAPEQRVYNFSANPVLPVDQLLLYMQSRVGNVDRAMALGIPAVLRGRNMICSISTLPLEAVDENNRIQNRPLFRQLDANVPNVVTLSQTLEDLVFDAVAWWRITGFDAEGYPSRIVRYSPDQVSLQPPDDYEHGYLPSGLSTEGVIWMAGQKVPFSEVIRFDSPNPALLNAASNAIRRAVALDRAAEFYAKRQRRRGYFTPKEADPANDKAIEEMLEEWEAGATRHADGYVPMAVEYNSIQDPTPVELQLVQMQQRVTLDLANALGIDPEDLGLNTTSRTYQNATDRRQDRINETLAPYMRAITDRLAMPDVTREGITVRFSLRDYLKADPKTRAEVQAIYHGMGATDAAEVRSEEGKPPRAIEAPAPPQKEEPVTDSEDAGQAKMHRTFAADESSGVTFQSDATFEAFAVDEERRIITGLAIPWNEKAYKGGRWFYFKRGGQRFTKMERIKFLEDHDWSKSFGRAVAIQDTEAGLLISFKVARGEHGDRMLALAADGAKDGLSVGVEWEARVEKPVPGEPNTFRVDEYHIRETSLLGNPAFDNSRLTSVVASHEGASMKCTKCALVHADGVTECATPPNDSAPQPVTLSAEQFDALMGRLGPTTTPETAPERPVVNPTARPVATTQVNEALPYRFSREGGRTVFRSDAQHDFSTDLLAVIRGRVEQRFGPDLMDAQARVDGLIAAAFADVESADVTALNPNRHRPDLWQPQMDYATPLWNMVNSGTTDGTKFDVPKFTSSSALVGPATEKVEPAGGSFVAELQTITPTQVWGKVEVSRQSWRAGGSPALSGILWDQMLREYYEEREAAVATFLNTLTAATDIALTTGETDADLANELEAAIAALQFVRGGNRFSGFAVHIDLYKALAAAEDTTGRKIYPMLNPTNANGSAANLFGTLNVAGTTAVPSWALGSSGTASANSWLFDPAKVRGWASAPQRLFWDFGATVQTANIPQLSFVTLGIYGDVAFANLDIAGVRQVTYDPVA